MGNVILELRNIEKKFSGTEVLKNIDLKVEEGEFITLLGPSGCGKTTTLRIIAGLEAPDSGRVILEGKDVTDAEPNLRGVNTVFQNYALFPHMNVEKNIGYGLRIRHKKKAEIDAAVKNMLSLVKLEGLSKRMPNELSGGQRQRVAIARALVNAPRVLLLDEPLGALDLKLRREMQSELKRLQKQLGLTFVYITHDQEEALNMSDRIAVMRDGVIEQLGTPAEVYDRPKTVYTAQFIGSANIVRGTVLSVSGKNVSFSVFGENNIMQAQAEIEDAEKLKTGDKVTAAVRSEYIIFKSENPSGEARKNASDTDFSDFTPYKLHTPNTPPQSNSPVCADSRAWFEAEVSEKNFAGGMLKIILHPVVNGERLPDEITASRQGIDYSLSKGDRVMITWRPEHAVIVNE